MVGELCDLVVFVSLGSGVEEVVVVIGDDVLVVC